MAWETSHTHEAWIMVGQGLQAMDLEELQVIYAEIKTHEITEPEGCLLNLDFDEDVYNMYLDKSKSIAGDALVEFIQRYSEEELRTCDNGGHRIWVCPYGCHGVRLSEEE